MEARDSHVECDTHVRASSAGQLEFTGKTDTLYTYLQEEELLDIFNKGDHAMQLEDSVEAVRVVRDSKTRIGKGIAYVLFKSRVAALAALQLNGSECKGRQMRVSRVEKSPAKLSGRGKKQGSNKAGFGSQKDKKTDGTFHWRCTNLYLCASLA